MTDPYILRDANGVEWICTDVSPRRSSYATYSCLPREVPDAPPRLISVPRSWDLNDPSVAVAFLAR